MNVALSLGEISTFVAIVVGVVGLYLKLRSNAKMEASAALTVQQLFTDIQVRLTAIETVLEISKEDHDKIIRVEGRVDKNEKDIQNQWNRIKDGAVSQH